ncbi:MAG: LOG family protein [bacterium]
MGSERIITVFGSSRAKPESNTYKNAYQLGRLLASVGFTICNGGYLGIMEASSQGAREAGGRTIGITTEEFNYREKNKWIDEEIKTNNYIERLTKLIEIGDAFVILKGGIGTLSELSLVWTLCVINDIHKPIVLLGEQWKKVLENLTKHLVIGYHETQFLVILKKPEDAAEYLKKRFLL